MLELHVYHIFLTTKNETEVLVSTHYSLRGSYKWIEEFDQKKEYKKTSDYRWEAYKQGELVGFIIIEKDLVKP